MPVDTYDGQAYYNSSLLSAFLRLRLLLERHIIVKTQAELAIVLQ